MSNMSREQMDKIVNDHFMYEATNDIAGVLRMRLLHVFHLGDGLIAKENVWFDRDEIERQIA